MCIAVEKYIVQKTGWDVHAAVMINGCVRAQVSGITREREASEHKNFLWTMTVQDTYKEGPL